MIIRRHAYQYFCKSLTKSILQSSAIQHLHAMNDQSPSAARGLAGVRTQPGDYRRRQHCQACSLGAPGAA